VDQADFALLAGLVVGVPLCTVALGQATALPLWGRFLLAFPCGLIPVALTTFLAAELLGRRRGESGRDQNQQE
jgi:hypothetical protein